MKKLLLIFFVATNSIIAAAQITLYNSSTREMIGENEGVTITFERKVLEFSDVQRHFNAFLNWGWIEGQKYSYSTTDQYTYNGSRIYLPCEILIKYTLTIRSPYYETFILSQVVIDNYAGDGYFKFNNYNGEVSADFLEQMRISACPSYDFNLQSEIYLVPKKLVVEGSMDVNLKTPDQSTSNLGLLSTKSIAEGLAIAEEEVIKLITSGQLKGKKIGEKYFVRKEDFDLFMKK